MGKNSRARRDARARQRQRERAHGNPFGQPKDPPRERTQRPEPVGVWQSLVYSGSWLDPRLVQHVIDAGPRGTASAATVVIGHVTRLWEHGWQPLEVVRQVSRQSSKRSSRLVEVAIHAEHAHHAGRPIDPLWARQLGEIGQRQVSLRQDWVQAWADAEGLAAENMVRGIVEVMRAVVFAPPLDELITPPGGSRAANAPIGLGPVTVDPILDKVRKLLAKAESTEFDAEAEALSAKAQSLMTQHAIDNASVAAGPSGPQPRMIRVAVDAPYADAKSYLLQIVAQANRCRAVFMGQVAMSSVGGMPDDLRGLEVLYTSLLVQAQHAMAHAPGAGVAGSRARSSGYKSTFLLAFASRIGERLEAANQATIDAAAAEGGSGFLPVLAAQKEVVDGFFDSVYGETTEGRVRGGYDALGAHHGQSAADRAKLHAGEVTS